MRIIQLGSLTQEDAPRVGGKARGLDFLVKQGYAIARGFVVTELFELGDEEYERIREAFAALGAPLVSVRSSATNEDGAAYSNAGQYETVLNVDEAGLREAVERCLSSLSGERAAAYSESFLSSAKAEMNLVIEEMVDAAMAGVMFTRDPATPDAVLIESVDGLGENLVSGKTAAYRYSISRAAFSCDGVEGNLSEPILHRLYEEGLAIAAAYGSESDLEWAVDRAGNLVWLQLRPITTVEAGDLFEFDPKEELAGHLFTSRNVGEMLPGAVTPLSLSTSVLAIDYGIRDMLRFVGCIRKTEDMPDFSIILPLGYHLFFDMTRLHEMANSVAIATASAMNISIMGEYYEDCPNPEGKKRNIVTRLWNCIPFGRYLFSSKKAKAAAERLASSLSFRGETTARGIYEEITEKLPLMNEVLSYHYVCSSFSGSMNSALFMMLSGEFSCKEEYQAFVATILSDIDGIESADILRALCELAEEIRAVCPDADALTEEALLTLVRDEKNERVCSLYRAFLLTHGHRSIKEAEMRNRGWRDDELALMRNLHTVLVGRLTPGERRPFDPQSLFARFGFVKRRSLTWIGANARRAVCEREYTKSRIIRVIDAFKVQYRALAALLVRDGLLPDEDLIYFLTHAEIGRLLDGESELCRRALSRRAVFPEAEELSYPDVSLGKPRPLDPAAFASGEAICGVPVSRGRVVGRARVVHSVADAEQLTTGEIMIAAFTDIGWSPYYSIIAALVTEVGSALSHGAVVAREYGLPTVVNAKNATKILKTGTPILVDATRGSITVLTEEEYATLTEKA